ncbi:hypothetical protein Tco_0961730 [Tanacetum coccineum]
MLSNFPYYVRLDRVFDIKSFLILNGNVFTSHVFYSEEQVLLAKDQAWMESSSDLDQELSANMVFMAKMEKILSDSEESSSYTEETIVEVSYYTFDSESESEYEITDYYDNSTNYGDLGPLFIVLALTGLELGVDFEKMDSPVQQTSSLKPYVPTAILENIMINLKDEVVSLLEKDKENLEIIESLKSKGVESSENEISESKNQSKDDCQMVEKDLKSTYACNDAMNVSCNSRLHASCNLNDLYVFYDIVQIFLWILDSGCSKHMMGNRALLMNFVESSLERFILEMMILRCYLLNDYDDVGKLKGKGILECLLDIQKNMLHSEFTISVLERFTRA